jgi:hypothetical protein
LAEVIEVEGMVQIERFDNGFSIKVFGGDSRGGRLALEQPTEAKVLGLIAEFLGMSGITIRVSYDDPDTPPASWHVA